MIELEWTIKMGTILSRPSGVGRNRLVVVNLVHIPIRNWKEVRRWRDPNQLYTIPLSPQACIKLSSLLSEGWVQRHAVNFRWQERA